MPNRWVDARRPFVWRAGDQRRRGRHTGSDSSSDLSGLADGRGGKSPFDKLPPDIFAARRKAAEETNGDLGLPAPPPSAFGVPMQSTPNG